MKIVFICIHGELKLRSKKMKQYLKLLRVKHWLKNVLIFLPLFFSKNILNCNMLAKSIVAFIIFSFVSSIVYITNDINDIENDKKHPTKKQRPLASGKISVKKAISIIIFLAVISILLISYLYFDTNNILVIIIPLIYLGLNIAYSIKLKQIPIIDVAILVSGFIFRVYYGGIVCDIEISSWLYLMVMFGSYYLAFGKRRNEMKNNSSVESRKVLKFYSKEFLDKNMYVSFGLAIISYSLWCVDPITKLNIKSGYLTLTIPLIMIIFQRYSLIIEGNSDGDPVEVLLKDKILLYIIFLYILLMIIIVYL